MKGNKNDTIIYINYKYNIIMAKMSDYLTLCRFTAKNRLSPLRVIQIKFQNAILAEHLLHQKRIGELLELPFPRAFPGKEKILGELLRNRAAAEFRFPVIAVRIQSLGNRSHVKSFHG